jgi:hypothetical protein
MDKKEQFILAIKIKITSKVVMKPYVRILRNNTSILITVIVIIFSLSQEVRKNSERFAKTICFI